MRIDHSHDAIFWSVQSTVRHRVGNCIESHTRMPTLVNSVSEVVALVIACYPALNGRRTAINHGSVKR
ncbi:MAG: hypothetical protein CMH67_12365 [Nisaea sp.]|nr:hypothetical protein [Nisaea sp.]OUX92213.1 MAG: hypothetical protein CBB86_12410 [Candidatus Endolissoclinum sp. TMED26]